MEDDLECEVLETLDKNDLSEAFNGSFIHLSPLRDNLLNGYKFTDDCDILEISTGLSVFTGYFCDVTRNVIAIGKKKSHAQIMKE